MKGFREFVEDITLQYHDTLNHELWENDKVKEDVRQKLLAVADVFREFCKIPKLLVSDVLFTGSQTNYNYTPLSDIDVHLVIDKDALFDGGDFVESYLRTKKTLWSLTHNIKVKGYPIELYAQDSNEDLAASGVYSLTNNMWLHHPVHGNYDFADDKMLAKKVDDYKNQVDTLINTKAAKEALDALYKKFFDMRRSALTNGGNEFSFDNLIFKELRNEGYIDKLRNQSKALQDAALSL